mmetsp:Transcript_62715/g.74231  ORF Transcript_62715/g.74231 Transcript_62715/m.74231 type:complete len:82 (+) Transcript_62715:350-595(+)
MNLKADRVFELNRQQNYLHKRHNESIDKRETVTESQNRLRNDKRKERMADTISESINALTNMVLPPLYPTRPVKTAKSTIL